MNQKFALLSAAIASLTLGGVASAAQSDGILSVDATLVSACTVSAAAAISFGSFSTQTIGDTQANSGSTFQVACSSDLAPQIFAVGTRTLTEGANVLPFNLSLTLGAAADDLPTTLGAAEPLPITQDGTPQDVILYARALTADFAGLPGGAYSAGVITVSVSY